MAPKDPLKAELKKKFVKTAKNWQNQKRRTESAKNKYLEAKNLWQRQQASKQARKREMDSAAAELLAEYPEVSLASLSAFLEDESHSSESSNSSSSSSS